MTDELLPCPFCGGLNDTTFRENGMVWNGMGYSDPVSVEIVHHCHPIQGQPSRPITRIGRDRNSAIAAWNTRSTPAQTWNFNMDEAPRDDEIMTWDGYSQKVAAFAYDNKWQSCGMPTHEPIAWQPLPKPPVQKEG